MNIPTIKDIDNAIFIYYNYPEIGSSQIIELFGHKSKSTINKLKKTAKALMIERNIHAHSLYCVNTAIAYEVWGIDVKDHEKRRKKLQELKLAK